MRPCWWARSIAQNHILISVYGAVHVEVIDGSMADNKAADELKDELDALDAEVRKQGAHVRQLKKDGADANEIGEATKTLQALKTRASTLSQQIDSNVPAFNRKSFDDLIIRKMFIVPSFEIHGGVKGLFDLGPPACALKVRLKSSSAEYWIFKHVLI